MQWLDIKLTKEYPAAAGDLIRLPCGHPPSPKGKAYLLRNLSTNFAFPHGEGVGPKDRRMRSRPQATFSPYAALFPLCSKKARGVVSHPHRAHSF